MDQPARRLGRSGRRAPPAALPHRGRNSARPRPEPVAPPHSPACGRSALLAASRAQHDAVARWKSAQPAGGDQAAIQICRACAHRHAANVLTHGARLRSWMEGWRITCPVCGAALEDFRLYTRLFRADPSDALLVRIERSAREGEQIMDRESRRRGSASAHAALMRDLLLPQVPRTATRGATTTPRLLDLVVPDSEGFFQRLQPENWPCTARMLPLSIRVPVLAGVAAVSSRPDYWIGKLVSAAAPSAQAGLMHCIRSAANAHTPDAPHEVRGQSHILRQS
jgi:hypothetical protein